MTFMRDAPRAQIEGRVAFQASSPRALAQMQKSADKSNSSLNNRRSHIKLTSASPPSNNFTGIKRKNSNKKTVSKLSGSYSVKQLVPSVED